MSTNILAGTVYQHNDQFNPNFKGWSKSAIDLYYALMSYASIEKDGYAEEEWYYINKKPLGKKAPGREWKSWKDLEETFGLEHSTAYRAKQNLKSGKLPYSWTGVPILKEDKNFIYLYNHKMHTKFHRYIDHSVMYVLSAYSAAQGGDTTIMRIYSAFKIARESKIKLSISQLLSFCGLCDIQYKGKVNPNREKIRNCLTFLKAFHLLELEDEIQLRGKINTLVFWASSFPPCLTGTTERALAFLNDGELTDEEKDVIDGLLVKFGE